MEPLNDMRDNGDDGPPVTGRCSYHVFDGSDYTKTQMTLISLEKHIVKHTRW